MANNKEQGRGRTEKKGGAPTINRVMLLGNLGRDPEVRTTQEGRKIASFSLATAERWKDTQGEHQERTDWHRVVVFNEHLAKLAETALKKGSRVYVEGQLQTRKWTDREGIERYQTEVVLTPVRGEMILWEAKKDAPESSN